MKTKRLFYYEFKTEMELAGFIEYRGIDKEDIISINYIEEKNLKPWILFVYLDFINETSAFNGMTFGEIIEKQYSYLDKINFKPYIEKYKNLEELWDAIEKDWNESEITKNSFLNKEIFGWIEIKELSQYIKEKYNVNYKESTYIEYRRS